MNHVNICYFAHDLNDAAVKRRAAMLMDTGSDVHLVGFVRENSEPVSFASCTVLGRTHNARFIHRSARVLVSAARMLVRNVLPTHTQLVLARNIEMLFLAHVSRLISRERFAIVYECLDIHPLMLNTGLIGRILRALERRLIQSSNAVVTSSPGFVREYFTPMHVGNVPVILVENRVYGVSTQSSSVPPISDPPWTIAMYGAIRCRKSLLLLDEVARISNGTIRVVIRGKVSRDQIPDFDTIVNSNPWLSYHGPYRYPDDLDIIYSGVHFNWTIDMLWEGQNPTWSLVNRIYEGGRSGVVPIALRSLETGRYCEKLGIGIVIDTAEAKSLLHVLSSMTPSVYADLRRQCASVPSKQWTMDTQSARDLVSQLQELS
jgi:succinoglycan biosynthesis protein ExoL